MNKVSYQYRNVDGKCKIIAEMGELRWECFIELPYPRGSSFWDYDQFSQTVVRKSKQLSKQYGGPEWTWE